MMRYPGVKKQGCSLMKDNAEGQRVLKIVRTILPEPDAEFIIRVFQDGMSIEAASSHLDLPDPRQTLLDTLRRLRDFRQHHG